MNTVWIGDDCYYNYPTFYVQLPSKHFHLGNIFFA